MIFLTTSGFNTVIASTVSSNDIALLETEKIPRYQPETNSKNNKGITGWSIYFDNDGLAGNNKDQGYSGGFSLSLTGAGVVESALSLDPVLGFIDNLFGMSNNNLAQLSSIEAGLTVFTPDSTEVSLPLPNELPYASLIYMSNNRSQINIIKKSALTTSFTLGFLGLKIAGDLQNSLHDLVGAAPVEGWDNQISAGGELTFRYSVAKQTILASDYNNNYIDFELTDTAKLNVGYLTDVLWGLSFRAGQLNSPWWSFNPELEEYTEKSANAVSTSRNNASEFYFWGGLNFRLRAYNAFLEGQFRDSVVTYNRDELNRITAELWIGITKQFSNGFRASYFVRSQTSEIKEGPASRNLVWGGIILSQAIN
ncbi:MAG: lipid A-modifier LpxR family protein [Thiohalomonadales bacterium]